VELAIALNRVGVIRALARVDPKLLKAWQGQIGSLHFAAELGFPEALNELLSLGISPNEISKRKTKYTRIYSRSGADSCLGFRHIDETGRHRVYSPFFSSTEQRTPLHVLIAKASSPKHIECLKILLQYPVDVNIKTENGETPLQMSLNLGSVSLAIFRALLEAGAAADDSLGHERTIAHISASMGLTEHVKTLLSAGVHCSRLDSFNQTPFDLALRNNHHETALALAPRGMTALPTHPARIEQTAKP
jgi:ankyrin repeat protein